jgi:3-phenylpropionate/cinnamic acid dioxygenase small subunit
MGDIEEFVLNEVSYLDEGRYKDWLELFDDDGIYWVAMDENSDPRSSASISYDDKHRRELRVDLMVRGGRSVQAPASEILHVIGNIRFPERGDDSVEVQYNEIVAICRRGGGVTSEERHLSAKVFLSLVRRDGVWKIKQKKVVLLGRDVPHSDLTMII